MTERKDTGLIFCISGPSGVGKDTIIRELLTRQSGMQHSISMTTRPARGDEREAVDYYFVEDPYFEKAIQEDRVLEYDRYCGHYYGTPTDPVLETLNRGEDVVLDITIKGALAIREKFPKAITIFLLPPSLRSLEQRLRLRGTDDDAQIEKRLQRARREITAASHFDYIIVNEKIPETINIILAIYTAERHRASRLLHVGDEIIRNG